MISTVLFRPIYDSGNSGTPATPWGPLFVAAEPVKRGMDVAIIDECVTPDYEARLLELLSKRPTAVGISTMTGEQLEYALNFARLVRKHSDAPIVWGGIHPTLLPEQTAGHELVDYVIAGEGEFSYADLLEYLDEGRDPNGIEGLFQRGNGAVSGSVAEGYINLEDVPEIPYELLDMEKYVRPRGDLQIDRSFEVCTSRGCPHHCSFCYIKSVHTCKWRHINAGMAVRRIKELVERFNVKCIVFREDNFFVRRKRVEEIARRLLEEKIDIKWTASCRIDYLASYTPEFLELIRESGCVLITFGVESGSKRVLDYIKKDISVEQVLDVVKKVKESGIQGTYHFMGGFPTETAGELLDTCRLIDNICAIAPEAVVREMSVFTPYPGVSLLEECAKFGYCPPNDLEGWINMDFEVDSAYPYRPWLTDEQSRLLGDIQFLIARLGHPNPIMRKWTNARWRQMLASEKGVPLKERPLIEKAKKLLRR